MLIRDCALIQFRALIRALIRYRALNLSLVKFNKNSFEGGGGERLFERGRYIESQGYLNLNGHQD